MENAESSSAGIRKASGMGDWRTGVGEVIIQDGKLGNTERDICKLHSGIEFGIPTNQSVSDVQPVTGSSVCRGQLWLETESVYGAFGSHTHLLTNLCQVGKSWPLSLVHLS